MPSQRRFYDSDVRGDPDLILLATEYARTYTGDFEFLVAASEAAQCGPLSMTVARAVLNCMRGDPRINLAPTRPLVLVEPATRPPRQTPVPPEPHKPPAILRVPVRTTAPFGVASIRGYKLHRVGSVQCTWRQWKGYHARPSGVPDYPWALFEVRWVCQSWNCSPWPILLWAEPDESDRCVKCFEEVQTDA